MSAYPTTPNSPDIDDLYAQRAALDAQIARKKRKIEPPKLEEDLPTIYGSDFVRDIGENILKRVPVIDSMAQFDQSGMVMARGIDKTSSDRAPFLAFRIELLTNEQERICVVTAKVFQSLYTGDDTQYISPAFAPGDDGNYYPSPLLIKETTLEKRTTLRDLIEGRKFIWDVSAHRKNERTTPIYTPLVSKPKARYFRLLGGVQHSQI